MAKVQPVLTDGVVKGYLFYCPGCHEPHYMTVHPYVASNGASWEFNGNLDAPTFKPSILQRIEFKVKPTTVCHSFVTRGEIQFLSDCTHALAGQTVELPEIEE